MKTYPLRNYVRRTLVFRLAVAAVFIALGVGLITSRLHYMQLESEVADLGRRGLFSLLDKVRFVMEREQTDTVTALIEVLRRGDPPVAYRAGRFVYVQFYDHTSAVLAEKAVRDQPRIDEAKGFVKSRPFSFPKSDEGEVETTSIGDAQFVLLSAPVFDRSGQPAAFVRGLFAVSPRELALTRGAMIRNTLVVIFIVIAVSALLYPVVVRLADLLADYSTHLLDANLETLAVLGSAIAKRDNDTDAHNYRVTLYSLRIGEALGLTPGQLRMLIKGSFLHDVGKLGIPDNILLKPGRLDPQEFSIMKTHVEQGAEIVRRSSWLREGIDIVRHHHEKFGGGGYPKGLNGSAIPITARIFAVADVFDALTSQRPYKNPLSFEETMRILERDSGSHFDPQALDAFRPIARELFDRYSGRGGAELREEASGVVTKYFSAGMDTLRY
jgi:HD-GYP domain-containing protein (c-di-GMP phosphodiesterase class II)